MNVTDVSVRLEPYAGRPVVVISFMVPRAGMWVRSVSYPPHVIMPDSTKVRMTPNQDHPKHSGDPILLDVPKLVTFVWDMTVDGVNPEGTGYLERLAFRLAYSNMLCHDTIPGDHHPELPIERPPPPPHIPPDPIDPAEPENPNPAPGTPGTPPVVPGDVNDPTYQYDEALTPTELPTNVDDPPIVDPYDVIVPGMPDPPVGIIEEPSWTDTVPVPAPPGPVVLTLPPVVDGAGLPSEGSTFDAGADQAPDIFPVPSEVYEPTEDPVASQDHASVLDSDPVEEPVPGDITRVTEAGAILHNTYEVGDIAPTHAGQDETLPGGSTIAVEVLPGQVIPKGEPVTVSAGYVNNGSDGTPYAFFLEYEDSDSNITTLAVGPLATPASGVGHGITATFDTQRFDPGTGTIRAIVVDSTPTAVGVVEVSISIEDTGFPMDEYRYEPSHAIPLIEDALHGVEHIIDGSFGFATTDPIFYVRATRSVAGLAVMLHPLAADAGLAIGLSFGPFTAGARAAATDTSTAPLESSNNLEFLPGSHHAILTELSVTAGEHYWIRVDQSTSLYEPQYNFSLYLGGFEDANRADSFQEPAGPQLEVSTLVVVHPQDEITSFGVDGSNNLTGNIYLPFEDVPYMLVNERTSGAVVVIADNVTDVQTDASPANARLTANVGDMIVVFRMTTNNQLEKVGYFPVTE